jgi:hypothetical protein
MPSPAPELMTKLNYDATTDVKVAIKRTVTYIIHTTSDTALSVPYAVAVDGVVRGEFKNKPMRVSGNNGKIVVSNVEPGKQVTLFLNSDAHPDYRSNPVYAVTPSNRDVIVKITEKPGKHSDTDMPVRIENDAAAVQAKEADAYTAPLTGDIWMKVSHKYSPAEVDGLLPTGTSVAVATAVKKIYEGLSEPLLNLVITAPAGDNSDNSIAITFDDGNNAHANIKNGYDTLTEGLTRAHPAGYAAIFSAAVEAGVNKLAMSSCWRPMLGKIPHRAGLGLDVNYVGPTRINRQELRNPTAVHTSNVSSEEKTLLAAFEAAKVQQSAARKALASANAEVKAAHDSPAKLISAKLKLKAATDASAAADKARKDAEMAWNAERDKNEPEHVRRFRASLMKCDRVKQVYDPWFMDSNTHDSVVPSPNMQRDGNENLHGNHLHITVSEPKIL